MKLNGYRKLLALAVTLTIGAALAGTGNLTESAVKFLVGCLAVFCSTNMAGDHGAGAVSKAALAFLSRPKPAKGETVQIPPMT